MRPEAGSSADLLPSRHRLTSGSTLPPEVGTSVHDGTTPSLAGRRPTRIHAPNCRIGSTTRSSTLTRISLRTFSSERRITLADICSPAYADEAILDNKLRKHSNVTRWFTTCVATAEFAAVVTPSHLQEDTRCQGGSKKQAKKKQEKKQKKRRRRRRAREGKGRQGYPCIPAKVHHGSRRVEEDLLECPKNAEGKMTCVSWFEENFDWEDLSVALQVRLRLGQLHPQTIACWICL